MDQNEGRNQRSDEQHWTDVANQNFVPLSHLYTSCKSRLTYDSEDGRTRQGSYSATESLSPPIRSNTSTTLPPYSSPRPSWTQPETVQHAKTPAEYLGLGTNHKRKKSDSEIPDFHLDTGDSHSKGKSASPHNSPNNLRTLKEQDEQSELDSKEAMRPLERHENTLNELAGAQIDLGISGAFPATSSTNSRIFTSPTISSRRSSTTEFTNSTSRHSSIVTLDSSVVEMRMDNLSGVQVSYYKAKSRLFYQVSTIESFRTKPSGHRYIIISPPDSSNIKLYFGSFKIVLQHGPFADSLLL